MYQIRINIADHLTLEEVNEIKRKIESNILMKLFFMYGKEKVISISNIVQNMERKEYERYFEEV